MLEIGFQVRVYYYGSVTDYVVMDAFPPGAQHIVHGVMPFLMGREFDSFYEADLLIQQTPGLLENIPKDTVKRLSPEVKKQIERRTMTQEQVDVMDSYTFSELKRIVKANYYPVYKIKNKKRKKSWVQPLLDVKTWGIRVFCMKIDLPDDLYDPIRSYL
jgi:hypothetical protein